MNSVYDLQGSYEVRRRVGRIERVRGRGIVHLLDAVVWWGALALIPLMALVQGADQPWWQAAFECYAFVLGALWIVKGLFKGSWPFRGGSVFVPLLLLVGYALFQTLPLFSQADDLVPGRQPISANVGGTWAFVAELLALCILGKLLLDYARDRKRLLWIAYVVIAVGASSAAFGIFRVIAQSAWPGLLVLGHAPGDGFAQFANRNYFALMLEMVLGLQLGFVLGGGVKREHLLMHIGSILLLATTIVLTTSRGGVLSMLSLMLLLGLYFANKRIWAKSRSQNSRQPRWQLIGKLVLGGVLACGLVSGLTIGVVSLGGDPLANRMEKLSGELGNEQDSENGRRGDIWRAAWPLIKAHPVTGSGFGAFFTAIVRYHKASGNSVPSSALNDYLNLLAGGGLIAAVIGLALLILVMLNVRQGLKSHHQFNRAAALGGLGGLLGVGAHSLVDAGLQVPLNALIFVVLIVIASAGTASKGSPSEEVDHSYGTFVPLDTGR